MRTRAVLRAVTLVSLLAAVCCFATAWRTASGPRHLIPYAATRIGTEAAPTGTESPIANSSSADRHRAGKSPAVPTVAPVPTDVVIPAVGLSARVVPVGLDPAGRVEIPDPSVVGWYRWGPAPGALGPAVLVGHVDTYKGPAAFYRLTGIRAGDEVDVKRADGSQARFVISKVTVVKKTVFPSNALFDSTPQAGIRLVTCTGTFNTHTRSYEDSLIAWGQSVSPQPRE